MIISACVAQAPSPVHLLLVSPLPGLRFITNPTHPYGFARYAHSPQGGLTSAAPIGAGPSLVKDLRGSRLHSREDTKELENACATFAAFVFLVRLIANC